MPLWRRGAGTLVSKLSDMVKNNINDLLSNSVMATGIVVGSILLASDQLFRVEKLTIGASTYLICVNKEKEKKKKQNKRRRTVYSLLQ